jgi:hypothetical protein
MVELIHPTPAKNVILYASYNSGEIRDLWSLAAEKLNLCKIEPIPSAWDGFALYLEADGHELIGPVPPLVTASTFGEPMITDLSDLDFGGGGSDLGHTD